MANEFQNGTFSNGYVYFNGQLLAQYANGTTYFAHNDHLGSTRLLTGMNQAVAWCKDYLPFGEALSYSGCSDTGITNHDFTGKERDGETGNDYFGARFYGSGMGRFLSPDPAGNLVADLTNPQSWNMYNYVLNNPLSFVDPFGLDCQNTWNNQGTEIITNCTVTSGDDGTCTQMSGTNCQQQYQQANSGPSTASIMQNLYSQGSQQSTSQTPPTSVGCSIVTRVAQGTLGIANLADAGIRAAALPGVVGGLAGTAPPAAGVAGVYGVVSICGQAMSGGAQLFGAIVGSNSGIVGQTQQVGNILAGPASGVGTLMAGGSMAEAERNANIESLYTGGAGLVEKATPWIQRGAEALLSVAGVSGSGCHN